MNIYLIRHGRQNSKLCNVDVELSGEGREQAHLVGKRLAKYGIEAVYSSNLIRAKETADERLREAEFGDLTGLENSVLKERYKDFLAERSKMEKDMAYPGGENCELVFNRVFEAIDEIAHKDYENVVVVTHGGAIRALLTGIVKADYAKWLTFGRQLENCSISEIMYDKDLGTYHIERLNDYAHFEDEDRLLRKHFGNGFLNPNK